MKKPRKKYWWLEQHCFLVAMTLVDALPHAAGLCGRVAMKAA